MISRFIGKPPYITNPTAEPAAARTAPILLPKFTLSLFCIKKLSNYYKSTLVSLQKYKINRTFCDESQKKLKYAILF